MLKIDNMTCMIKMFGLIVKGRVVLTQSVCLSYQLQTVWLIQYN
jgi:hypothetical protein